MKRSSGATISRPASRPVRRTAVAVLGAIRWWPACSLEPMRPLLPRSVAMRCSLGLGAQTRPLDQDLLTVDGYGPREAWEIKLLRSTPT